MLNFPDTPALNQVFSAAGCVWKWDGVKWLPASMYSAAVDYPPILVTNTTSLPPVTKATVNVANGTGTSIAIGLPVATATDQTYRIKDTLGNFSTFPVQIQIGGGYLIDGKPDLWLFQDWQAVEIYWTGSLWCVR